MRAYNASTPVVDGQVLIFSGGGRGTRAVQFRKEGDGIVAKELWHNPDQSVQFNTPVVKDGLVYGLSLSDELFCLDKQTGKTVWKTNRSVAWNDENEPGQMARDGDHRKAHGTPLIVTRAGKPLMLSAGAKAAYAYDPRTGRELWMVRHTDYSTAPVPLFDRGVAFFVTGLRAKELLAVKTGGQGDVTDTAVLWKFTRNVGIYASPLLIDGLLYTAAAENYLTCLEAATGQLVWSERIPGQYAASPIYADGRISLFTQTGTATVIKPGRTFTVLATNTLADGFMASPAVSGKALYLRTKTSLYRIQSPN